MGGGIGGRWLTEGGIGGGGATVYIISEVPPLANL